MKPRSVRNCGHAKGLVACVDRVVLGRCSEGYTCHFRDIRSD